MSAATMIEKFIALRDKVDEIKKLQTKQLEPYASAMQQLEGLLLAELERAGVSSMKGDAGTVYTSTTTSVVVKDWPETFGYIKTHELWDLLEARVSKTATLTTIQETGKPIPGVQVSQAISLRVRRS
jgi:2-iminoacetate synthase ThiH